VTLLVNANPSVALPQWWSQTYTGSRVVINGRSQGAVPPTPSYPASDNNFSVWTFNGCNNDGTCDTYTLLDLTKLPHFSTSLPLLFTLRNTLPSSGFSCSGAAVPFSTAEYTNYTPQGYQDPAGAGGGLMGPYVPLVDYADFSTVPRTPTPLTAANLPDEGYCGRFPISVTDGSPLYPALNNPAVNGAVNWPTQYWGLPGDTNNLHLQCGASGSPFQPQIYFVATQRTSRAINHSPTCNTSTQPNPCNQIVAQGPQETWDLPSGQYQWQPALPITIVGTGFGYLPQATLPLAVGSSSYLEIIDDGSGSGQPWDTNNGAQCQMYIANWTDNNISVIAGVPGFPTPQQNGAYVPLPPLDDVSPWTFFQLLQGSPPPSDRVCPVAAGDHLTFTVTNPQNPGGPKSSFPPLAVSSTNTPPL